MDTDFAEALPDFIQAKLRSHAPARLHPLARRMFNEGATLAEAALAAADEVGLAQGQPGSSRVFAAFTESDFPAVFRDQAAALVQSGFALQARHRQFCKLITLANFKTTTIAGIHPPAGAIEEVGDGEEIQAASVSEGAYATTRLRTYAGMVPLTRRAILSDDLGAFSAALGAYGVTFSSLEAGLVYGALEANADLSDAAPWFNANAGNLLTGAALSAANLGAAMAALKKQAKDEDGTVADADAFALITSADDEATARQLVRNISADGSALPPKVFATARIPGGAGAHWYLAANPATFPTVGVFVLDEREQPEAPESRVDLKTDQFQAKLRFDVAAAPLSRVGIVRCEA